MTDKIRVYTQNHTFFNDLVTYLGSLISFSIAINSYRIYNAAVEDSLEDFYRNGSNARFIQTHLARYPAPAYGPYKPIIFEGILHTINQEIHFYPYNLIQTLTKDKWPDKIEFEYHPISNYESSEYSLVLTEAKRLPEAMIGSMFINYYEKYGGTFKKKYGPPSQGKWPKVWDFARVLRNACAHGGEIKFYSQNSQEVQWKTLTYGPRNNGHRIFQDFSIVEFVTLMEEMDTFALPLFLA